MAIELSEQEQLRRQSLKALRDLGIEPLPRRALRGDGHGTRNRRKLRRDEAELRRGAHRGPHHVAPHHGQRLVLRTARPHGPHPDLHPPRRHLPRGRSDALQHRVQETARHRRLRGRRGIRLPYQHGRACRCTAAASPCCRSRSARCPWSRRRTAGRSTPSPTRRSATASATST